MLRKMAFCAFWTVAAGIAFATICPIQLRPSTGHFVGERFVAYLLLGLAAALTWPGAARRAGGLVIALAVVLELAQRLIPSRHGLILDSMEKIAGGLVGFALAAAASRLALFVLRRGASAPEPMS